jgi:RNase adaptor protein for sRNA GlmZ degradation
MPLEKIKIANKLIRTYANNSRNPDSTVGAIHVDAERLLLRERFQRTRRVLPLPRVVLRKSYLLILKIGTSGASHEF